MEEIEEAEETGSLRALSPKLRALITAGGIGLALDQLSKAAVELALTPWDRIALIPGFLYITHTRNPGAAFGLFATAPRDLSLLVFTAISLAALIVIATLYRNLAPGDRVQSLGLSLILSGAIGNFADRLWRGEVVDFLHVRLWGGYAWPDFNVADVCVFAGVVTLVIDLLSREATERALHR
jgi:signal peptidase II